MDRIESKDGVRASWPFLLLTAIALSCASSADPSGRVLLSGDQMAINSLTEAILSGEARVEASWVEDSRSSPIYFVISEDSAASKKTHYGVDIVGDYYLCLLEVRSGLGTRTILESVDPELIDLLDVDSCGVCCSQVFSLSGELRSHLQDYWKEKLLRGYSGGGS